MKKIAVSIFLSSALSSAAFAADVKITSFRMLGESTRINRAAELCGELTQPTGKPEMVRIVSDPQSKTPGKYYVWAGADGKFCSVIATYTNEANADLNQ